MTNDDKNTLHYMRGRLDSLYTLMESHLEESRKQELRLRTVEKQLFVMKVLGPGLAIIFTIGYGIKRIFLEG